MAPQQIILQQEKIRFERRQAQRAALRHGWMAFLRAVNFVFEWMAYFLRRWSLLEVPAVVAAVYRSSTKMASRW